MISLRALLPLALLVLATVFTTVVNAADSKGPKITNKVYFDIKQGDQDLGRSKYLLLSPYVILDSLYEGLVVIGLYGKVRFTSIPSRIAVDTSRRSRWP